ncbi:monoacylglycerol lipase ABHD6-like [Momordica charantia]|uniref:Monoacylglycerol lipase ABHD6-like n=1 Tax=Momordica charantia TaxID=3673 RepID=A0A6J1C3Y0_MOMCH|nr:monoacylglycerol lipase ABHD6-like [Momordica charantia]
MAACFSFSSTLDSCFRYSFSRAGLKSTTTDLGDGTIMHCWAPKIRKDTKPNLLLLHGFGANAMWQWNEFISPLIRFFNVYVPDLIFFGNSYTTRPERSESFQARCMMRLMDSLEVQTTNVVGISYGGFVSYSMAAQFPERLEKVVLCCAGVCLEEKDMADGMFVVKNVDEAASILLPQTPAKLKELIRLTFVKPARTMPTCIIDDFIDVMCTEYKEEKEELIKEILKDRNLSNLPKITQPTLIIWGEQDRVFPLELAYRLQRHLGENAEVVVVKEAGHAINAEKPKEMYKHIKAFLTQPNLSPSNSSLCSF